MEQLVINAREIFLEATGEENLTGGETETGQISSQDEHADMDSVHGADSRTEGAQKRTHMFYFVKHHQYELTPEMVCKIEEAQLEIRKRRKEIENLTDTLRQIKSKRDPIVAELKYRDMNTSQEIASKSEELASLKGHCTTKEREIIDLIKELKHRIQNENLKSIEERKLIKQMESLQKQIDHIRANGPSKDEEEIDGCVEETIQYIADKIDHMKTFNVHLMERTRQLRKDLDVLDRGMRRLQEKINVAVFKRDKAHCVILKSEKMQDEANEYCSRSRELITDAQELVAKKDKAALAELSRSTVEKFFSKWNTDKAFRMHYGKRAVLSLDSHGFSTDGRSRNPCEFLE
ncbi:proton pump-interactor BIP103-like isoform X2 [Carex rostrata]